MGLVGVVDLMIENEACRSLGAWWALEVVGFSCLAGLAGSLVRLKVNTLSPFPHSNLYVSPESTGS